MWLTFILFAASFLLSALLAPKPKIENAKPSQLSDIQVPRASEGDPVPAIFGTVRLKSPNTLWYGDFRAKAIKKKVKTGLFSSKSQVTGYKYYLGFDLGLCLGPDVILKKIWAGKKVLWEGTRNASGAFTINKPNLFGDREGSRGGMSGTVTFYKGDFAEQQNAYLQQKVNPNVPAYNGICRMVFHHFYIGKSAQLEQLNFELQRFPNNLAIPDGGHIINGLDCNPMEVLFDAACNKWGLLGIESEAIDIENWREAAIVLAGEKNGVSLVFDSANTGKDVCEEVLKQIDAVLYQDPETTKIRIKLIRQDYVLEELPELDPSNVKDISNYSVQLWSETFNQVRVTYANRGKDYARGSALAQDFANINFQNRVKSSAVSFPGCADDDLANQLAARQLSFMNIPLIKCTITLNRSGHNLRPGDVFKLSWPAYGLVQVIMRIQRFDMGELANGRIVMECLQDRFASTETLFQAPSQGNWDPLIRDPLPLMNHMTVEAPYWMLAQAEALPPTGYTRFMSLAMQPGDQSQFYSGWMSRDGFIEDGDALETLEQAIYGNTAIVQIGYVEAEGFATGRDGATGITVSNVADPDGLVSATVAQIRAGSNLVQINGEILAFESFSNLGNGSYLLTGIHRALLDTRASTHPAGSVVYFLSADVLHDEIYPASGSAGVKLLDNTDLGAYDIGSTTATAVTPVRRSERPLPPAYLTANGSRTPGLVDTDPQISLAWRERNRLTETSIALENDATASPEAGTVYEVRWRINSGSWHVEDTQTETTASINIGMANGTLLVEVAAIREGLRSFTPAWIKVPVATVPLPSNTAAPVISGLMNVGSTLTVSDGTWTMTDSITYQWTRDGVEVAGATTSTYTLTQADLGAMIACNVTGTNVGGSTTVTASAVGPITELTSGFGLNYGNDYGG